MAASPNPPQLTTDHLSDLPQAFSVMAAGIPDRVAIMAGDRGVKYHAVAAALDSFAKVIASSSPTIDPLVAIDATDSAKQWLAILAVLRLGWRSVSGPLPAEIQDQLGVNLLLVDSAKPPHLASPNRPRLLIPEIKDANPPSAIQALRDQPGRVILSSGTTGAAKPVPLDGTALRARLKLYHQHFGVDAQTRAASLLGSGTNPGFFLPLTCWLAGGQVVLPAQRTPDSLAYANLILASPIDLERILESAGGKMVADPQRRIFIAGGRLSPNLRGRIARHLGPNITMMYGSAEAAWVCRGDTAEIDQAPGAVGFPLPGVEVEIVDDQDRAVPAGVDGRVRIRSPYVVAAARSSNGWFYPGDRGAIAANGLLCITGRMDDVLNVGGAKIAPTPLEAALERLPGVREAAVARINTAQGAERLAVVTVTEPTADWPQIEALIGGVMRRQPPYLNVRIAALPRGAMGKLDRRALADQLADIADALNDQAS